MDDSMEGIVDESVLSEMFGKPENPPRVGDQYQVHLPPLMTKNDRLQLIKMPVCAETMIGVSNHFDMCLSIPITWVHEKIDGEDTKFSANSDVSVNINGTVESENSKDSFEAMVTSEKEVNSDNGDKGFIPLPGLSGEAWNDIKHDSFVLGLYVFGKNLRLVKKIVGSKGMGSILSYYYGEFYRSCEYRRWSDSRKSRTRRSIHGERIFTSWRQQELLSRLFSKVTEECKNRLTEASRLFGEGKLPFEEYVFALKDMVGINLLVEAVAIGKGKRDLTGTTMEPLKNNNSFRVRSEVPNGKAYSSLTSGQIVKFLTGDVRLSKARSSDLFWEAIWPRLLARGWHSEQKRNYVSHGSKHSSLVFLIPGVEKFSKRKLLKGSHYFDSLTDVLNKVASEPQLLDLETEDGPGPQMKQDSDGFSSKQHHCYLQIQPRNFQCIRDQMKFTIVDTSLVCGEERVRVRELRSLPFEPTHLSTLSSISGEIEQDTAEECQNEAENNNTSKSNPEHDATESRNFVNSPECESSTVISSLINHKDLKTSVSSDGPSRIVTKFKFSRKMKYCRSNDDLAPPTNNKLNGGESHCWSNSAGPSSFEAETDRNPPLMANSLAGIAEVKSELDLNNKNEEGDEPSLEKQKQARNMIDLNLPHVPLDLESDEASKNSELLNPSNGGVGQRQKSTRNRPLTTKALEALACGFLSPKKKRKGTDGISQNNSTPKPSRRVRAKTALVTSCGGGSGVSKDGALYDMEKGVEGK